MAESQFPRFIMIAPTMAAAHQEDLIGCVAIATPRSRSWARGVTADYLVVLAPMFNHPALPAMLLELAPCFATSGATHG